MSSRDRSDSRIPPAEGSQPVFKAVSHPVRRRILQVLHFGGDQLTSQDIAKRFDLSWPTISRHLGVLEEAGIVRAEERGRQRYYSIEAERLVEALDAWLIWFRGDT